MPNSLFSAFICSEKRCHPWLLCRCYSREVICTSRTSLQQCKKAIADIQIQQTPYSALHADWQKFEVELGPLTDDDSSSMQLLATHYCEALLANLDDRFPEPHVLSAFQIFDSLRVPMMQQSAMTTASRRLMYYWQNLGSALVNKAPPSMRINC